MHARVVSVYQALSEPGYGASYDKVGFNGWLFKSTHTTGMSSVVSLCDVMPDSWKGVKISGLEQTTS